MSKKYVVVVGAVNIDIGGAPEKKLIPGDSNPGSITSSLGGVGRNIAHNLSLMGLNVRLITALGNDNGAARIRRSCQELGIDVSASLVVPEGTTSSYLFINDQQGDMALAISDMKIYDSLSPDFLESRRELFDNAQLVVADTNISQECLLWLSEHCTAPLFCDPVSVSKAEKLRGILGSFHTIKPNRIEAELLSGISITDEKSLSLAAKTLISTGLRRVFISLGDNGMLAADNYRQALLPCLPTRLVNATGGGDAATAALALAYTKHLDLEESAALALAAGSMAVEHEATINPNISYEALNLSLERKNTP